MAEAIRQSLILARKEDNEIEKALKESLKPYTIINVTPKRTVDFACEDRWETRFRIAEGHFYRMLAAGQRGNQGQRPKIQSIDACVA